MVPVIRRLTGSKSVFFVVAAVAFSRSYCTHTFSSSCSFTKLIPGLSTAFDLTLLNTAVLHKLPHKTSRYEQKPWEIHLETSLWKVHMFHQCPRISFKLWRILDWQVSPDRATYDNSSLSKHSNLWSSKLSATHCTNFKLLNLTKTNHKKYLLSPWSLENLSHCVYSKDPSVILHWYNRI